jgi:hypothetical protein
VPDPEQIDASIRRGINLLTMLCRRHRMAPGDRFPAQDALRRELRLTNYAISGGMAVLARAGVVARRQRSGTVFNGFAGYPRHLLRVGVVPGAVDAASPAAVHVFARVLLALFREKVGIRVFPPAQARAWRPVACNDIPGLTDSVGEGLLDGILLPMQQMEEAQVLALESAGVPVVFCGCKDDDRSGVLIDHRVFAAQAVANLAARGSRRIALAHIDHPKPSHGDFWIGFTEGMTRAGLPLGDPPLFASGLLQGPEGGDRIAAQVLALPAGSRPEALVMPDDRLALEVQRRLLAAGLRLPLAVQANVQLPLPFPGPVRLHAIDLDLLAQEGVRLLMARLTEPSRAPETVRCAPRLHEAGA